MAERWGLCATIKAPLPQILGFAAHHLDLGAHRLYLYLDADHPEAYAALKAHPKIRVTRCDAAYWKKSGARRPKKHQLRQSFNATHAYHRRTEVPWLIHIDVDEFLWPETAIGATLAKVPDDIRCLRVRPMEMLSGNPTLFKAFIPPGPAREPTVARLYPTYGQFLKGGFISHVAGKLFVRTGLTDIRVQIHNAFQNDEMLKGPEQHPDIDLAHLHAANWDAWIAAYRFRVAKGSYRAELAPNKPRDKGGLSMHELLTTIEAEDGEAGLRAFFDELCADTPQMRDKLAGFGLLKRANLGLKATLSTHFPQFLL